MVCASGWELLVPLSCSVLVKQRAEVLPLQKVRAAKLLEIQIRARVFQLFVQQ